MSSWALGFWGVLGVIAARGYLVLGVRAITGEWIWTAARIQLALARMATECFLAAIAAGAVHTPAAAAGVGALVPVLIVSTSAVYQVLMAYNAEAQTIREHIEQDAVPRPSIVINVGEGATVESIAGLVPDPGAARISESMEKQEAILREMYTQGLAQARNSFRVSLAFATIGSIVLLSGIGLAIWNAPGSGERYASIVATSAGIVINLTSSVFFVQSNRARKSMGDQGAMLREESRDDRRLNAARELAAAILNSTLRDDVRAQLALQLLSSPQSENPGAQRLDSDQPVFTEPAQAD